MTSTEAILPSKKPTRLLDGKFEFKSIKTKLTVVIVTILIVSGVTLAGIAAFMASNALEVSEIDTLHSVGEGTSEKLWLVADMGKDIASLLSIDPTVKSLLVDARDGTLTSEKQLAVSEELIDVESVFSEIFDRINVLDNEGILIASTLTADIGMDYSDRDVFINQEKEAYVGEPYLGRGDIPRVPYARPVYDENGQQIGLVFAALSLSTIDERVFSTPGLSDDSTNFLVGPDGTILSGVKGDYSPFLKQKFDLSIFLSGENIVQAPGYYGYVEYIVRSPVPGTTWSVITTETVEAVDEPIMSLAMMMIVSLLIVIVVGTFMTAFIANGFSRPIQSLTDNAKQLALGDVDVTITHAGSDEIGQLAESFRCMTENTKKRVDAVQKIAYGNINFEITTVSDKDAEGKALIKMKRNLSYMVKTLDTLAQRSAEGDLSYHADGSKFQGVYRELIGTLDQAFHFITIPVQEAMRISASYSSGDYSDRFDSNVPVKGDFEEFKAALNQIGINTSDALLSIRSGVHDISTGASESSSNVEDIASAVATLAEGSSRVSSLADSNESSLDQALTAMTDLADTVGEVAQRTTAVSELASQSSDLAYDGVKRAEVAGKGMEEVTRSASEIAKSVSEMSSHMDEIGGIVDVISGIAEQTSLLALNAAIEAARAGDAGLGFAVVADEVKALAQDSQTSAEHIGSIIGGLQKMTTEMTDGMEKTSNVIQSGNNAVNETITILNQMAEAIADVNRNMSEVAAASEEQAASVQEITASMNEVRNMVQDTAREATDSAAASEEISASLDRLKHAAAQSVELAEDIEEKVQQFKIE
jgi:methyl-accepting chemotaxis protein